MKLKQGVSLKNLNSIFTGPLKKFDALHKRLLGTEAVVTSVDTGRHWGSIKKQKRPFGWEDFTEMQVRELSDSKHYNTPCDAADFRRRNPDTHSDLNYYDDLLKPEQQHFKTEIYECFPDEYFDVVFSRLCIHIEWDPDFDVRKTHKLTDEDLEMRQPVANTTISDEIEPTKLPKLKVVVSAIEKIELDWAVDRTTVVMGAMNFLAKHFTGYFWFKRKIGIKNDQSIWGRLLELINVLIDKIKGLKK